MPYLDSKIAGKHKAGCKQPKAKRLYIRDYDVEGKKQIFIPYGITCPSCKVIVLDVSENQPKVTKKKEPEPKSDALEQIPCLKCEKPAGRPENVERFPVGSKKARYGGSRWEVKHDDGRVCTWVQHSDIRGILPRTEQVAKLMAYAHQKTIQNRDKLTTCPGCEKLGYAKYRVRDDTEKLVLRYSHPNEKECWIGNVYTEQEFFAKFIKKKNPSSGRNSSGGGIV